MLRALGALVRPGGHLAFLTIHLPSGLAARDRARAREVGPRAVASRGEHRSMLGRAGFDVDLERDVTTTFLETARAWHRESERLAGELAELLSAEGFDELQEDQRRMIAAIEDGLLVRTMYVATRRTHRTRGSRRPSG